MLSGSKTLDEATGSRAPFKGSIEDITVFDLYRQLYLARQTGILELRQREMLKSIIFRNGSIVFAIANQDSDKLGTFLIGQGKITASQLEKVLEVSQGGMRLGQAAQDFGFLNPEELDRFVRMHQSEVAISSLAWASGSFCFQPGQRTDYEDVYVELSTAEIIFEGVRRIISPDKVEKLLGSCDAALRLASDPLLRFQKISLDPREAYVFSRVEEGITIRQIMQVSALDPEFTMKTLLGLKLTGLLEYAEDEGDPKTMELVPPDIIFKTAEATTPELDPDLGEDIRARCQRLTYASLYEILDAGRGASSRELEESYFRLAKRFHPDRYSRSAPPDVVQMGERLFQAVDGAYRILMDSQQRSEYDERLDARARSLGPDSLDAEAEPLLKSSLQVVARRTFEEGMKHFRTGRPAAALRNFREAVRADGAVALYQFYLAHTLASLPHCEREAELHYQMAIHQEPSNPEYPHALGDLYMKMGLSRRAHTCFAKARKLGWRRRPEAFQDPPPGKRAGLISRFLGW
jgi:tetratricopeptide (TPR) repeat protein